VQYIADQVPGKNLAPANGTYERYRLQEWLTFIGTELHKAFQPLFNPATPEETKPGAPTSCCTPEMGGRRTGRQAIPDGRQFTVADGYLFTVTNWASPSVWTCRRLPTCWPTASAWAPAQAVIAPKGC
jgi:glutathione S-transferase